MDGDTGAVIDVVLPCRDEAGALPWVLSRVPAGYHAIVVDNGSRDATAAVARAAGATVVSERRPGYGAAVHAGIEGATADVVCVLDGDASLDPGELPELVETLRTSGAAVVGGRRRPRASGAWPWHARAASLVVAWRLRHALGLPVHDVAPVRVARREALLALHVADRRSGYPVELLVRAARAGWTVAEVDVSYGRRASGTRSKVSGSVRGTLRAAADFARELP